MKRKLNRDELAFYAYLRRPGRRSLTKVVRYFHVSLWNVALRLTGSESDASDLCQDLFLSLLLKPPSSSSIESPRGYLVARLSTLARNQRRRDSRRNAREVRAAREWLSAERLPAEDLEEVRKAILDLPPTLRTVVVLRYLGGLDIKEIAAALEVSTRSVERRLAEARSRLGARLEKRVFLCLGIVPIAERIPPPDLLNSLSEIVRRGAALAPVHGSGAAGLSLVGPTTLAVITVIVASAVGVLWRFDSHAVKPAASVDLSTVAAPPRAEPEGVNERPQATGETPVATSNTERPAFGLEGVVLTATGKPCVGATIEAHDTQARQVVKVPGPTASVRSGAGGRFAMNGLKEGTYHLVARSPAHGYATALAVAVPGEEPLLLRLQPGVALEVLVTDTVDVPLEHSAVRLRRRDPSDFRWVDRLFLFEGLTDTAGVVMFTGIPDGTYFVRAEKTSYFDAHLSSFLPVDESIHLRLKPGAYIAGRAYLRDLDHPLRDGIVEVCVSDSTGYAGNSVPTGPDGAFNSKTIEPGKHTFVMRVSGERSSRASFQSVAFEAEVAPGRPADDLVVVFEEGIRIEGNLLTGGGATIPHQNLIWKSMDRPDVRAMDLECSVDDSGRFELEGLAPGRYLVAIEKSGVTAEVQLSDDAYQDLEVVMDPPVILRLRVEDPDGLPVGDTRVTIHEFVNGRRLHHVRFLFTDARGRCTLAGVGLRGRLVMAAVNEAGQGRLEVNAADVDTELTIRLLSGATVTGRIVNSQGEPMADAVVVAMTPGEFKKEWRYNRIVADEEGRFAFESFPGRVRLRAKNAAHGVASLDFDVEPGEDHKLAPVVLGTSGAIRGVVVDSDGHPVQAVTVKIHAGTRELETMEEFDGGLRTDADGWFAAIAPDGVYTLKVRPDVEPGPATVSGVRPGDPPVRIRMDIE